VFGIHGVVVQVLASLSSHNLLASIIRNHKQKEGWMKAATSLMKCDHYSHNWIDKKKNDMLTSWMLGQGRHVPTKASVIIIRIIGLTTKK